MPLRSIAGRRIEAYSPARRSIGTGTLLNVLGLVAPFYYFYYNAVSGSLGTGNFTIPAFNGVTCSAVIVCLGSAAGADTAGTGGGGGGGSALKKVSGLRAGQTLAYQSRGQTSLPNGTIPEDTKVTLPDGRVVGVTGAQPGVGANGGLGGQGYGGDLNYRGGAGGNNGVNGLPGDYGGPGGAGNGSGGGGGGAALFPDWAVTNFLTKNPLQTLFTLAGQPGGGGTINNNRGGSGGGVGGSQIVSYGEILIFLFNF